jgi:uncharacterized protein (DUF1778 family)
MSGEVQTMSTLSPTTPEAPSHTETKNSKQAATRTRHDARIDFRLSRDAKERIEKAALVSGQSLSDFAAATLVRESEEVLARHGATVLSERDRDLFLELLDNPPDPSPDLRETLSNYERVARSEGERTVLHFSLRPNTGEAS